VVPTLIPPYIAKENIPEAFTTQRTQQFYDFLVNTAAFYIKSSLLLFSTHLYPNSPFIPLPTNAILAKMTPVTNHPPHGLNVSI
jgi:hypothetical protein